LREGAVADAGAVDDEDAGAVGDVLAGYYPDTRAGRAGGCGGSATSLRRNTYFIGMARRPARAGTPCRRAVGWLVEAGALWWQMVLWVGAQRVPEGTERSLFRGIIGEAQFLTISGCLVDDMEVRMTVLIKSLMSSHTADAPGGGSANSRATDLGTILRLSRYAR
jgi:hypothetical protein